MIINILGGEPESEAFGMAAQRILHWSSTCTVDLHVSPRKPDGWLEYLLAFKHPNDEPWITIGMIQRKPGAAWEFHS